MSEWQPIETAPRDGTEILLMLEDDRPPEQRMVVAWFYERRDGTANWAVLRVDGSIFCVWQPVTHWMPLPEPPQ